MLAKNGWEKCPYIGGIVWGNVLHPCLTNLRRRDQVKPKRPEDGAVVRQPHSYCCINWWKVSLMPKDIIGTISSATFSAWSTITRAAIHAVQGSVVTR